MDFLASTGGCGSYKLLAGWVWERTLCSWKSVWPIQWDHQCSGDVEAHCQTTVGLSMGRRFCLACWWATPTSSNATSVSSTGHVDCSTFLGVGICSCGSGTGMGSHLRIGEVLQSFRSDLILPQDTASGVTYVLLKIMEPKTRGKHARHQAARVDQSDILHGFSMSAKIQSWSWAGAQKRQMAVDPCDGDLSPGGAGRNFVKKLEPSVRAKLEKLAQSFAGVLEAVVDFWKHGVPTKLGTCCCVV